MLLSIGKTSGHALQARTANKRVLLVVTPFCSPSYAYPGPAYLARYLREHGVDVRQADLNLALMLKMFSRAGLARIFDAAEQSTSPLTQTAGAIIAQRERYLATIETVIRYLQGRDHSMAYRVCQPGFLPRADSFDRDSTFAWHHGSENTLVIYDRAKFVCTQYLYDLATLIRETIFPFFQITLVDRLYDSIVHFCTTFDGLQLELEREPNVIDTLLHEVLDEQLTAFAPDLVGVSVPFARNLYWALRIARRARERMPALKVAMGGGLVNTSMRDTCESRLFQYIDYLTVDDGERPLLCIIEHLDDLRPVTQLKRTFYVDESASIQYADGAPEPDARHTESGAPDYSDYRVQDYFSTLETTNINQRIHSDGWWNKLTMAHGCYRRKCAFCDIHLSYIRDYQIAPAKNLVDKVEQCISQTGQTACT